MTDKCFLGFKNFWSYGYREKIYHETKFRKQLYNPKMKTSLVLK